MKPRDEVIEVRVKAMHGLIPRGAASTIVRMIASKLPLLSGCLQDPLVVSTTNNARNERRSDRQTCEIDCWTRITLWHWYNHIGKGRQSMRSAGGRYVSIDDH